MPNKINLSKNWINAYQLIEDFIDKIDNDLVFHLENKNKPFLLFSSHDDLEKVQEKAFKRFNKDLYSLNIDFGFDDEFITCSNCFGNGKFKLMEITSANYTIIDSMSYCKDCILDLNLENKYFNTLINNPKSANELFTCEELINYGWTKIDYNYKNGLHIGENANPETILEEAIEENNKRKYIFNISNNNPFTITFELWFK